MPSSVRLHAGAATRVAGGTGGGIGGILKSIGATVTGLSHTIGGAFAGVGSTGLVGALSKALLSGFFHGLLVWVANGAASLVGLLGKVLSETTAPALSGSAFRSEFEIMALLSAGVALPLLAVAAIQAIIRQEPGAFLRSALVRLPLALLFTGVSVQFVALGLAATDQASAMVLRAASNPTHRLLLGLVSGLNRTGGLGLAAFGAFLVVLTAAMVAFVLWLELAVRSAAIAAASLFLPLALVGLAWPATAHWARRLGETLAALVLSKFVIVSVLALAAGLLGTATGISAVVEGVALLAVAAFAPFALLKLVPAVEAGAVTHLEGLSHRPLRAGQRAGTVLAGVATGGPGDVGTLVAMAGKGSGGSSLRTCDSLGSGPFTADRPETTDGSRDLGAPPDPVRRAAADGSDWNGTSASRAASGARGAVLPADGGEKRD
ncbi:MAG: hypothetical protein ABR925_07600 [Acidimicrobiales bacterium]